jgi:hypothetical protein
VNLDIPRAALQDARVQGRPFARGRVVITFSDGSFFALKLGGLLTGEASQLVKALTAPGTFPAR